MDSAGRAKKSGLGYAVEKKQEDNYDRDEAEGIPSMVVDWINGVMAGVDGYQALGEKDWKSICMHLRSGVILCKLINVLLKQAGLKEVSYSTKVMSPFQAMTNIENFNKGVAQYGLSTEFQFQSGDLYETRKGPFYNVLNALSALGFAANDKNVSPTYKGKINKTIDRD